MPRHDFHIRYEDQEKIARAAARLLIATQLPRVPRGIHHGAASFARESSRGIHAAPLANYAFPSDRIH